MIVNLIFFGIVVMMVGVFLLLGELFEILRCMVGFGIKFVGCLGRVLSVIILLSRLVCFSFGYWLSNVKWMGLLCFWLLKC